jgi:magnesium-transporting ATPase (P-type)
VINAGTQIVQTRSASGKCEAMVLRTGFNTSRGSLVRAILYPKPVDVKFENDGMMFIGVMAILAVFGFMNWFVMQTFLSNFLKKTNIFLILLYSFFILSKMVF